VSAYINDKQRKRKRLFAFALALFPFILFSQNPEKARLVAGPVVGAVTKNSAKIWITYRGSGQNMMTLVDTADNTRYYASGFHRIDDHKGNTSLIMDFAGLSPEHVYKTVFIDPLILHPKCVFETLADSAVKDLNFILGSCALMNTGFSRMIFPGDAIRIFFPMKRQKADFMLWLGDNIYYFSKNYSSYEGMFQRNLSIRKNFLTLRDFMASQPNYAIWDDHDYGWNDADKKFPLKDSSLAIFKGFWPNPYDEADTSIKGNYFNFRQYDAEFFMTDSRWYRDIEGDTAGAFLGKEQISWLKKKLKESDATFKFICTGSQVLNESYYGESYAKYPKERNELLDFIANNNIKGVIFLTGDKHYAELAKRDWKGYPIYDFTSSPLTSPVVPVRYLGLYKNTYSIHNTILYKKNFGKISITGPAGNRTCSLQLFGKGGRKKWEYIINEHELERKEKTAPAIESKKKKRKKSSR